MSPERPAPDPDDRALTSVVRGGGLNIAGALCSQVALFAITTIIARLLGRDDLGQYALGFSIYSVLGLFVLVGFQSSLTRFVAIHLAEHDAARLRGALRIGLGTSVGLSVIVACLLAAVADPLSSVFGHSIEPAGIRLVALALPAATIRDAALAGVQGWRTQRAYALVWLITEPIARLGLTVAAIAAGLGVNGAFGALAAGSWLAAVLALLSLRTRVRAVERVTPRLDVRPMLTFTTAAWGTALSSIGLVWADTLLLGVLTTPVLVGTYTVATRLVNLAVFVIVPVNAAFAPLFARLLHLGDETRLRDTYGAATTWITRLSLPAFVALLAFPADLLHLFGPGFSTAMNVTIILCVGQIVNALTGPAGTLLNMSGRVRTNMANNAATLVLNIGLNLWLIPTHGIEGAAIAWSVSLAVVNLVRFAQVHTMVGGVPFGRGTAKAFAAAVGAAAVALGVRQLVGGSTQTAILGCLAVGISYLALVLLLRLEPADRALLADVVHRGTGQTPAAGGPGRARGQLLGRHAVPRQLGHERRDEHHDE